MRALFSVENMLTLNLTIYKKQNQLVVLTFQIVEVFPNEKSKTWFFLKIYLKQKQLIVLTFQIVEVLQQRIENMILFYFTLNACVSFVSHERIPGNL